MKKLISMLFMAVLAVLTMTGCDDEETVLQKYTAQVSDLEYFDEK